MTIDGGPLKVESSEIPWLTAVASTNGLKALPACRWPWEARLNWRRSPLGTSTSIARIFPLRGSIATSAAAGSFFDRRIPPIASFAAFCSRGSIVVLIRRPPPRTFSAPNADTSWSSTYPKKYGWRIVL